MLLSDRTRFPASVHQQRQPCTLSFFGSPFSASPESWHSDYPRDSFSSNNCPYIFQDLLIRLQLLNQSSVLIWFWDFQPGHTSLSGAVLVRTSTLTTPGVYSLYTLRSCLVSTYLCIPCCILPFDSRSPSCRSIHRSL